MFPTHRPGHLPRLASRGLAALALTALLNVGPAAIGDSVTFATFSEVNASRNNFLFTNNVNSATLSTQVYSNGTYSPGAILTYFSFALDGLANDLNGPQSARMTVNLTSNGYAFQSDGIDTQPLSGTISFTRTTAAAEGNGAKSNLLTITLGSTTNGLSGSNGGRSAGLNLTNTGSDSVTFTSDFVNFSGTDQRNIGLTFTSLSSSLGLSGNYLSSFSASGSGQFADDPGPTVVSTPEPSTLAMVGCVAGLSALVCRFQKRAKAPSS